MSFEKIFKMDVERLYAKVLYITKVHYPKAPKKGEPWGIRKVKVINPFEQTRSPREQVKHVTKIIEMIESTENNVVFFTSRKIDGEWIQGQIVEVGPRTDVHPYIISKPNDIEEDNLEELSKF